MHISVIVVILTFVDLGTVDNSGGLCFIGVPVTHYSVQLLACNRSE